MRRDARVRTVAAAIVVAVGALPSDAWGMGVPGVAGLQVGLTRAGLYAGPVDGVASLATQAAVRAFQLRKHLTVDGVAGARTRAAFGAWGRYDLGERRLERGDRGWDVAELQFLLAWHGFPSARFRGVFNRHVVAALKRFQRYAGLQADGVVGNETIAALRTLPLATCPIGLALPAQGWLSSPYGPRWLSFHPGVDLAAASGTPVFAAAAGRVSWAAPRAGGWGNLVVVRSADRIAIFYAHLSAIEVRVGQRIARGGRLGLVGSTGNSTGPHLYMEVRVGGATVNPLPALSPQPLLEPTP